MANPYEGTSANRLVALINADNETSLVLGTDFTFGVPSAITGDPDNYNTKITLVAPEESEFVDTPIKYNRLPLSDVEDMFEGGISFNIEAFPFSIRENLPLLNAQLNLNLDEDEVEDTIYTEATDDGNYEITVADGSLAWVPASSLTFTGVPPVEDPEP